MSEQGQLGVDRDRLENAVKKLEAIRDDAFGLARGADAVTPGELTAQDVTTHFARQWFQKRINGDEDSMQAYAMKIRDGLQQRIDAYRATLDEYARAEDNATADNTRLQGEV